MVRGCIIGVDGGGSGCRAALADVAGRILGTGLSGPANVTTDPHGALANVTAAVAMAVRDAGRKPLRGHAGLAGILDESAARPIAEAFDFPMVVTDDRRTTLAGALGDRDGILIALGTGTIVGRRYAGAARFVGGYGLGVSDEASGGWLGRGVLSEALRARDGIRAKTPLLTTILERFDDDPHRIVAFVREAGPADFASLAPLVLASVATGDRAGKMLMRRGASYLIHAVRALGIGQGDAVCLAGGVGPSYATFLPREMQARLVPPAGTSLDGAVSLARASKP